MPRPKANVVLGVVLVEWGVDLERTNAAAGETIAIVGVSLFVATGRDDCSAVVALLFCSVSRTDAVTGVVATLMPSVTGRRRRLFPRTAAEEDGNLAVPLRLRLRRRGDFLVGDGCTSRTSLRIESNVPPASLGSDLVFQAGRASLLGDVVFVSDMVLVLVGLFLNREGEGCCWLVGAFLRDRVSLGAVCLFEFPVGISIHFPLCNILRTLFFFCFCFLFRGGCVVVVVVEGRSVVKLSDGSGSGGTTEVTVGGGSNNGGGSNCCCRCSSATVVSKCSLVKEGTSSVMAGPSPIKTKTGSRRVFPHHFLLSFVI